MSDQVCLACESQFLALGLGRIHVKRHPAEDKTPGKANSPEMGGPEKHLCTKTGFSVLKPNHIIFLKQEVWFSSCTLESLEMYLEVLHLPKVLALWGEESHEADFFVGCLDDGWAWIAQRGGLQTFLCKTDSWYIILSVWNSTPLSALDVFPILGQNFYCPPVNIHFKPPKTTAQSCGVGHHPLFFRYPTKVVGLESCASALLIGFPEAPYFSSKPMNFDGEFSRPLETSKGKTHSMGILQSFAIFQQCCAVKKNCLSGRFGQLEEHALKNNTLYIFLSLVGFAQVRRLALGHPSHYAKEHVWDSPKVSEMIGTWDLKRPWKPDEARKRQDLSPIKNHSNTSAIVRMRHCLGVVSHRGHKPEQPNQELMRWWGRLFGCGRLEIYKLCTSKVGQLFHSNFKVELMTPAQ